MTADLVASSTPAGAEDMASLEALDPQARDLAVTHMLSEARSWLTQALETSEPASIATFRAQMATIEEATRQLSLSKEIRIDAQEMVRRAERGVAQAVRKGQEDGTVMVRGGNSGPTKDYLRDGKPVRIPDRVRDQNLVSPRSFYGSSQDWSDSNTLADAPDEVFEEVLAEAKAEDNMSRANVIRKVKNQPNNRLSGQPRLERIAELAAKGWTSGQIGKEIGHGEEHIRRLARRAGIEINADRVMHGMSRRTDHNRIASNTVIALDGLVIALQLLNIREVDLTHADEWVTSLNASLRSLNRFRNDLIKEMTTHDNRPQA